MKEERGKRAAEAKWVGRTEHRRAHLRFEVLGTLSASVLSNEIFQVLNLGGNGALIEGCLPLPLHAEYRMQLVLGSHVSEATVKVRRVESMTGVDGSMRYQLGVEFLALSADAEDTIRQMLPASQVQV